MESLVEDTSDYLEDGTSLHSTKVLMAILDKALFKVG